MIFDVSFSDWLVHTLSTSAQRTNSRSFIIAKSKQETVTNRHPYSNANPPPPPSALQWVGLVRRRQEAASSSVRQHTAIGHTSSLLPLECNRFQSATRVSPRKETAKRNQESIRGATLLRGLRKRAPKKKQTEKNWSSNTSHDDLTMKCDTEILANNRNKHGWSAVDGWATVFGNRTTLAKSSSSAH